MAKRSQKQKQIQRQSLTNVIKIALDRKKSSGRRRSTRRLSSQQETAQQAQQALLSQLLISNQPQRLGYSLLERQLQDEKMRNLERTLKDTEARLRPVNPMALPSYSDGSMTGRTARQLLREGGAVKEEKPMLMLTDTEEKRQFLIDNYQFVEKLPDMKRKYTEKQIESLKPAALDRLYNQTYEDMFGSLDPYKKSGVLGDAEEEGGGLKLKFMG